MRYITTPIYYASGSPHLGHAYTTVIADCYRRFYDCCGETVMLITGTDEHGQKIERNAQRAGIPVHSFVAARSDEFRHLWKDLGIEFERFSRTTEQHHENVVRQFWQCLVQSDDIYLGEYKGLYCVDCEQYFTSGETCPVHLRPLEEFAEASYFFRLGRYQGRLIDHITSHPDFIFPRGRRNEVLSFLKSNQLNDLSVSRTSTRWGIAVPGDPDHVMYVWIDALVTYLSSLGDLDNLDRQKWSNSYHFIGKDILIFHAIYWPALLMSAKLAVPKTIFVNGWLTVEGRKISKSDASTIIDPASVVDDVGIDGLKYYLCQGVQTGQDLDFSKKQMITTLNADLANNIGNLFSRVIALTDKYYSNGIRLEEPLLTTEAKSVIKKRDEVMALIEKSMAVANVAKASRAVVDFSTEINRYLQKVEPWRIVDDEQRRVCLWFLHHCLADLTILAYAFMPGIVRNARQGLCLGDEVKWGDLGHWCADVAVKRIQPVYRRLST